MCDGLDIVKNQLLCRFSTIGIGGLASELAVVTDERQLLAVPNLESAKIVGLGSNILFADAGFDGLVLVIKNQTLQMHGCTIEAGAGCSLAALARQMASAGLAGLEWACGIPSSLGGAVYMNAGAHGSSISDVVQSVRVLRGGKILSIAAKDCGFSYRSSAFMGTHDIILSAKLTLKKQRPDIIFDRIKECMDTRKKNQPRGRSLGSVFKNADRPAGFYIDSAGLKGTSIGDLIISEKHANFIINRGNGTAKDFLALVDLIKTRVHDIFGITLKEEFQKIGNF